MILGYNLDYSICGPYIMCLKHLHITNFPGINMKLVDFNEVIKVCHTTVLGGIKTHKHFNRLGLTRGVQCSSPYVAAALQDEAITELNALTDEIILKRLLHLCVYTS